MQSPRVVARDTSHRTNVEASNTYPGAFVCLIVMATGVEEACSELWLGSWFCLESCRLKFVVKSLVGTEIIHIVTI